MLSRNGKWGRRWLVSTAIGLFLISTASANQVTNGDMETGGGSNTPPAEWNVERGTVGISSDTPTGIGQSLSITSNENTNGGLATQYNIPVEAGVYQFSFSYKGGSPRWLMMKTSDYATIGADNLSSSSVWTTYSTQVTIPSGVTSIMVFLYSVSPNTTVLIDDVVLASTVSAPIFTPGSRYISGSTSITISSDTPGTSIYYTTDRSIPTTGSTLYTGPVTVSNGTMLKAIAVKTEGSESLVTSQTFFDMSLTSGSVVANGTMEVGGDSTTPPDSWQYLNPGQGIVGVSTDTFSGSGQSLSVVHNGTEFQQGGVCQVIELPLEVGMVRLLFAYKGDAPRWVLFDLMYNTVAADNLPYSDGWTTYSTEITLTRSLNSAILVFYAYNPQSQVLFDNVSLTPVPTVKTPVFSPESRYISGSTSVTISSETTGAAIYYTLDGSTPTTASTLYSGLVTVSSGTLIKAIAIKEGFSNSSVASKAYYNIPDPSINLLTNGDMTLGGDSTTPPDSWLDWWNPAKGIVCVSTDTPSGSGQSVFLNNNTSGTYGAAVYQVIGVPIEEGIAHLSFTYTGGVPRWLLLDGSYNTLGADNLTESSGWTTYSTTINIPAGVNSAMLVLYAKNPGDMLVFDDVVLTLSPRVSAPVFSPKNHYLTGPTAITITCATDGAAIHYTTDGTPPTAASPIYSGPVTISGGTMLRAIGVKDGLPDSVVADMAFAHTNLITNGDMELGGSTTTPPSSWDIFRGRVVASTDTPSGSGQSMLINNNTASTYGGAVSQIINVPLEAGTVLLSFKYMGGAVRWLLVEYPWGNTLNAENLPGNGDWVDYATQVNIPDGIGAAQLIIYAIDPDTNVVIDDVGLGNLFPATKTPVFSPAGPYINGPTQVTITCASAGSSIYYTTDGTVPTNANTPYTGPIEVTDGTTLKAMALTDGHGPAYRTMTYVQKTIPIMAWLGNPPELSSLEVFRTMREAGFTHNLVFWGDRPALDAALEAGIKLLLLPTGTVSDFVNEYKDHPALEAYYLADEPSASQFSALAQQAYQIQALDPNHWCHINLNPIDSWNLGSSSYQSYVDSFLSTVPVSVLTFDFYPITSIGVRVNPFYQNLEIISAAAKAKGIPFWAFARSTSYNSEPVPTLTHLRYQMFSNLAYGAQGLQYWTYWQPADYGNSVFYDAPINRNGEKTNTWYVVQQMNEEIKGLSKVFLGATVQSVGHTGSRPSGTTAYTNSTPINSLTTSGSSGAVVSRLVNGTNNYLVVVNRDINNTMTLTVSVDTTKNFSKVSKDGTKTALTSGTVSYTVNPADIVILNWGTVNLSVTPSSRSVTADAGTTTFAVNNSGGSTMGWSAQVISGSSWASITSGSSGINDGTISLSYAANTSITSRTATIRITAPGSTTTDVTIVQAAADLTPGDANGDGAVNVSDLSLLAANYGTTSGATWGMGDFTGDGAVNVSDLSLLAANYGTGSSDTLSWADAYAQAFGTTADTTDETSSNAADDSEDASSSICSGMGLPLIAGLLLMGLMLVKLEE